MDSPATTTEAIAAVIDAHTPTGYEGNVTCWCGPNFDSWAEHAEHVAAAVIEALEAPADIVYLPNEFELMAARGAIASYINSIENGHLRPTGDVLNTLAKSVVLAMRWRPRLVGPWQEQP